MATTIRIKRSTGSSAPTSLSQAELAYAEGSDSLWIGVGTGGSGGSATSIKQIGGGLWSVQSVNTVYAGPSAGSSASPSFRSLVAADIPDISGTYLTVSSASSTYAPLGSPALAGTPTAPTASQATNSTQIATTAYVRTAISDLVGGAGSALDTLKELQDALGSDANFATTVSTSLGQKLAKTSNLSDLADAPTARTNLGLGSIATQSASNVSITGGSIDGVTLDAGAY